MWEVNDIRSDFPILQQKIYGKPLVYLDNAATTQKPRCVVEALESGYYQQNANIHRGVHYLSRMATEAHESARRTVQQFLNAGSPSEIIFTRGTTEAINLLASSYGHRFMKPGDEVIVSTMEHHSNIVPWQLQEFGLKVIPMLGEDIPNPVMIESLFTERTKLVAITHVSNVLGTVNPVKDIIRIAHRFGVPVFVDGAQAVAHQPVDVQALDVDFYAFSGHKIYAPAGIGVLYGKERWLEEMPPYQGGGEMIASVSFEKTTYNALPYKFEAGTPDFIGSTALAEALLYINNIGWENICAHEKQLIGYANKMFKLTDGVRIIGDTSASSSVISFLLNDIHPYDTGMILDSLGIAVRTGHHCAEPLIRALGLEGTVRASFAIYNTTDEIAMLMEGLERVKSMF
jgi:cysteine desulfurase/selenocysteine lyase